MFDFCGIGNACIDIVARVDDKFLRDWEFEKSICTYLKLEPANALESALPSPQYIPGGCAANTAACISSLGGSAAFIGCIAQDSIGERFLKDMKDRNIRYTGKPRIEEGAGSTRIFAMTTPDAERTFAAFYGVQEDIHENDLDNHSITQSKFLYLDGYALNSKRGGEVFLKAAQISKEAGQSVAFTPSDLSILKKYGHHVDAIIKTTDVFLCNEQEAMFLSKAADLQGALKYLQNLFSIGAVTAGERGVYAFNKTSIRHAPASRPIEEIIDTNGAGDGFAGGFLFGLSRGYDIEKAAKLGNRCAAAIITHVGARPIHDYKQFLSDF